ncbi:MAG TPA: endonuclease V [Candidatus Nanoarchaeia archaeon]|nr:endonuclease V [Candidatus Nanoarchaeia archaeon]
MDTFELKKEQLRMAQKIILQDGFDRVKTIGGVECVVVGNNVLACVVVCEYPSLKFIEKKTYLLPDPLPFIPGFSAYREMPAMVEAYNLLEQEPDVLLVKGEGIIHPRKIGIASHLGLVLNKPTIGVTEKLLLGRIEQGKVFVGPEILGFEVITREHAKPSYISPSHLMSLGSCLNIIKNSLLFPHKMPEPLHLAHKIGKKQVHDLLKKDDHLLTSTTDVKKQSSDAIASVHHELY